MKVGYSFEGLVNRVTAVDESAVHKTGDETVAGLKTFTSCPASSGVQGTAGTHLTRRDFVLAELNKKVNLTGAQTIDGEKTFSSNLTAPAFLSSAVQNTAVNATTRKDYVDAGLANKLNLSGGTMTGNLAAPTVLVSSAQNTSANALTRKDYVDFAIAAGDAHKVSKYGDTMTGNLTISNFAPILVLNETDTGKNWFLVADGSNCRFQMDNLGGRNAWEVNSAGTVSIYDPISTTAQGGAAGSLTRKDYVDGQVATRAPMAHTHTVAAITDLKPQDSNATANTLALRDWSADVHARLLRTTYGDEPVMSGAIAFRINNSTDNFTRYCSNPAAVREWMRSAKTSWDMNWRAYIEDPNNPMTEYHVPGRFAVATYLSRDGAYLISSSNGSGGAITQRLSIDYDGNLHATGGVHDMGQRVYSPNNQPHNSHNHTAAQGNSNIVQGQHSVVGSYIFATLKPTAGSTANPGTNVSGVNLHPCGAGQYTENRAWVLAGTWMCMGAFNASNSDDSWDDRATLWFRVA